MFPPNFKGNLLMAWKFIYQLIRPSDINPKPSVFTDPLQMHASAARGTQGLHSRSDAD